jgi:transposase
MQQLLLPRLFVGIDWASQTHAVCVLDPAGEQAATFQVAHTAEGFDRLVNRLALLGDPAALPVAIERPDGRLVDRLLQAGHPVMPVKPAAIRTWRQDEVPSGAKSDPGDAYVIAEYLRLRHHRLRRLEPFGAHTRALRAVVRTRDDLVAQRIAATNQLSALLDAFWPGAKHVFADLQSPIALAFLGRYPTPESAERLGERRMQAFLVKHGYSGRQPAAKLIARLRAAPPGIGPGPEAEARRDAVLAMVGVIQALNTAITDLDRSVIAHLGEHPDAEIFTSLPRSGRINAAQVLAEWGDCRPAYDSPEAVAALAGATPVTKRSGKHTAVHFRWACNKRFRKALMCFADNSRRASPWAAKVYADAVARGHDHPHAIRILARAWIRVIWRCWLDQVPYDPAKHASAKRLTESAASSARG